MEGPQQKEEPIVIPTKYSHLCIPCAKLVDINEFKATHREQCTCVDRISLEDITKE